MVCKILCLFLNREKRKFKGYVHNKARPEGSKAEGYIAYECLTFCSRYLGRVEKKFSRRDRNHEGGEAHQSNLPIFRKTGKPLSKGTVKELSFQDWDRAQLYILRNCEEV